MSLVNSVFLITHILGTFSVFNLMSLFFDRKDVNRYLEVFSYLVYYIVSGLIFIFFPIPICLLVFNIVAIFGLSLNYRGYLGERILVTIYIYLIMFSIEVLSIGLFETKKIFVFKVQEFYSISIIVFVKLSIYIISIILSKKKNSLKKGINMLPLYYIGIISIPVASLVVMILFIDISTKKDAIKILVALFGIIIINFASFQLYNYMLYIMNKQNIKAILQQQKESYYQQLQLIYSNNENIAIMHHDIKNHLFMMKSLFEKGEVEDFKHYLHSVFMQIENEKNICNSGNIVVDSIINYKLKDIDIENFYIDICLPDKLQISDIDMTSILANLLDNSIRAVEEVKDYEGNPRLHINLSYIKGRLFIQIENSYKNIEVSEGVLQTTKEDKRLHGLGIESVKHTIQKYNGDIGFDYTGNIFSVIAVLYC